MKIFTIGAANKSAEKFFEILRASGAKRVADVRLYNTSQLAGFSKKEDLAYFLKQILGMDYIHLPILAPTPDIFDAFKKQRGDWAQYEQQFRGLMQQRQIEKRIDPAILDGACLLCSEERPTHCHRRLVAEYLREHWNCDMQIVHL